MSIPSLRTQPAWSVAPASGRGRSHGTSRHAPFDRWFRYPAGFASDYVELLLDQIGLESGTVVDCFAGSGVTGTAARARGLDFAGIEAHPLMAELATAKVAPSASGKQVSRMSDEVVAIAREGTRRRCGDLDTSSEPELIRRSFTDQALADLVSLRELVKERLDEPAALYLKWALLGTLRDVAAVKVGWPHQRPGIARRPRHNDVMARFESRAQSMAQDLLGLARGATIADGEATGAGGAPRARIVVGDSRDDGTWADLFPVGSEPGRACITSPPYLNNFDYADATRIELYFWGSVSTWREMCQEVRADMLTATTQQSSVREMDASIRRLTELNDGADGPISEILGLVEDLRAVKRRRERRSKEYEQVAPAYFVAMWDVLKQLYDHLEPGSQALWLVGDSAPYGVYVDTPRLIGELAEVLGFDFVDDVSLRERGNRWGRSQRYDVKLAERIIVLRRGRQSRGAGDSSGRPELVTGPRAPAAAARLAP